MNSPVLLQSRENWEEWYDVVQRMAHARGVFHLIDVNTEMQSELPTRPNWPEYADVSKGAVSYAVLDAGERDHYKFLLKQYRMRCDEYEKQQKALIEVLEFIEGTIARNLRPFILRSVTPYDILKNLQLRLHSSYSVGPLHHQRVYDMQEAIAAGHY